MKKAKINSAPACLLALPLALAGLICSSAVWAGAAERWENAGNVQRRAWGQDNQVVLPAEKREKLHRLGPEELYSKKPERNARVEERNTAANKRENRRQRRKQKSDNDSNNLARRETPPKTTAAPEPAPALVVAATTPTQAAVPATVAAVELQVAPPLAQAPRQPAWVLPALAALFLLVLLVLLLVLRKVANLWRGASF